MAKKKKVAKKKDVEKKKKRVTNAPSKNTRMGNVKTVRSSSRNSPRSEGNNLGKAI